MAHPSRLNYRTQGQGPVVVLSHALGCHLGMWDEITELLQSEFTVVRYDHRGHGLSEVGQLDFNIEDLADDASRFIQDVVGGPVHFVGLSMGGMVAQALAHRQPDAVKSIVIANSACHYSDEARHQWQARIETVRSKGMSAIADGAMQRWFSTKFRTQSPRGIERVKAMRDELIRNDPQAYAASCAAVAGIDFRKTNPGIRCKALIIAGERDEATPMAMSEAIADQIPQSQLVSIDAAHLSAIEQPEAFVALLKNFWH